MPIKYILQKDIPERMAESDFGLKHLRNDVSLMNICDIFDSKLEPHKKAIGFWYSKRWYWLANLEEDYHFRQIDYSIDDNRKYYVNEDWFLYDIRIDEKTFVHLGGKKGLDKIIQIRNYGEMADFYEKYKYPTKPEDSERIDWKKVYMEYGGIELDVTHHEKYLDLDRIRWWFGWDVASGCIWNGEIIKKIKWIL